MVCLEITRDDPPPHGPASAALPTSRRSTSGQDAARAVILAPQVEMPHDSATRRAVSDGARRISIGSKRTLPGIISSLPCKMSCMTWSTSAAGDIFALLTVRVAGVSTSGGMYLYNADANATQLPPQRQSKGAETSLGRGVGRSPGCRKQGVPRGDHDDHRASTRTREWQQSSRQQDRSGQVHSDLISDAFVADRLFQQINPFHDTGIVDQYIQHAVAVANGLYERQHVRPHRDVALNRIDRRVFCLQLTKCHVIPPAGDDLGTLDRKMDCELPTDPRRATRHHNGAVAPGTASRARVSHSSTVASLSGPCSLEFQRGTQAIEITAYSRHRVFGWRSKTQRGSSELRLNHPSQVSA